MAFSRNNSTYTTCLRFGNSKKKIYEGETYNLIEVANFKAYAGYSYGTLEKFTNQINTGELKITKLTSIVVSGSFWFIVIDNNEIIHQIRDGRFNF